MVCASLSALPCYRVLSSYSFYIGLDFGNRLFYFISLYSLYVSTGQSYALFLPTYHLITTDTTDTTDILDMCVYV